MAAPALFEGRDIPRSSEPPHPVKLRVLQIGWADPTGQSTDGATRYTQEILSALESCVEVYYERMYGVRRYLAGLVSFTKYRREGIDIVHVLGNDLHGLVGIFTAALLRKPLVLTVYAHAPDELNALSKSRCSHPVRRVLAWITNLLADVLIVTSEWQRRRLEDGIRRKAVVIYPGVRRTTIRTDKRIKTNDAMCITGSLVKKERALRKGIDLLMGIARLTPEIRFHVVGRISHQLSNVQSSVPPNVIFRGSLDETALVELLSRSRFILAPSRHEAFSISVLEGMRYGCIPIVSEFCGIQDILDSCGYVLPLLARAFSETMRQLLKNDEETNRRSLESERISECLTWNQAAYRHVLIYREAKLSRKDAAQRFTLSHGNLSSYLENTAEKPSTSLRAE